MPTEPSTQFIVSFKHYEHQGLDIRLTKTVGEGHLLEVIRCDTRAVLLKIELPANIAHYFVGGN